MGQRRGIAAILVVAAACLLLAGIGVYASVAILDEDAFADRAASAMKSDEVREEVALRIASRAVEDQPSLAGDEAAVEDAALAGVTSDPGFPAAFRAAAATMHHALFSDADADASLRVAGSGAALQAELEQLPGWGSVPALEDPWLLDVENAGREKPVRALAPLARDLTLPLAIVFGLLGAGLLALGIVRAPNHRRAVWTAGVTIAAAGGLLAAGLTGASDVVLDQFDTGFGDAVVSQLWSAFLGDLRIWALALGAAGLVVAAAAGGPRISPRTLLATPASGSGRLLRAAGLLALAGFAVALPEMVLHIGLVTLAAALVYVAVGELLRVLAPPNCAWRSVRAAVATTALLAVIAVAVVPAG
jgi:hypothetical protein